MESKHYKIGNEQKNDVLRCIESFLEKHPEILFAYVHGSFITQEQFRDIDIAVYVIPAPEELVQAELDLEVKLCNMLRYPVDVRILNSAPLSFRYHVIKQGRRLAVKDDDARCDFEERAVSNYFDFEPYRKMYLQETLNRGI